MLKYLSKKMFSVVKGDIKFLHSSVTLDVASQKELINHIDEKTNFNHIHTGDPLEGLLQVLAFCKLRTMQYNLTKLKLLPYIKKINVQCDAQFDLRIFFGTIDDPIRYKQLDIKIDVEMDKNKKLDDHTPEEFTSVIEKAAHRCPVYGMLSKAGIPETFKINLI